MYDLIVIGGGPAGTAAAITAARSPGPSGERPRVLLLERGSFPRQKVCGEFVSSEALDLLRDLLGIESGLLDRAPRITRARLLVNQRAVAFPIKPAAASIPRWDLDEALWQAAVFGGAECRERSEVESVCRSNAGFSVATSGGEFCGRAVVDATGRWSRLRPAPQSRKDGDLKRSQWIGLKAHYADSAEQDAGTGKLATGDWLPTTDLYFFEGGYCGVQPVTEGRLNVCAMVRPDRAVRIEDVFKLHPSLRERSRDWKQVTEPVAVAPLSFAPPVAERDGVLCVGDAAGFIDPFAGDGISLALRSGKLAAESLAQCWHSGISHDEALRRYRRAYQRNFAPALRGAAHVRTALKAPPPIRAILLRMLQLPGVANLVVRSTR
ncbi:MAG: NAD(P)/FAD-dependent oxidoreductase [Terriglobales bacterium]